MGKIFIFDAVVFIALRIHLLRLLENGVSSSQEAGYGPCTGIPQSPAFPIEKSLVGLNSIFGMLIGAVIFLFWIFPQRFFDPVVKLLEASQRVDGAALEEIAHPLWRGIASKLDETRREALDSQKELNQMRSLLLSFFNTAPADMFVKTVEGQLVYCSPGLATVLGRTQEEMAGMFESEYHSPEHLERVRRIDVKLVRERKPLVAEIFNPVLQRHELQTRFPIFNDAGDVTHIGGMFIDIDERVKAQQNPKKAEEWLEAFLRNAPFTISLVDPDNDLFLKANAVGAEMYDMTPDEMLTRKPSDVVEEFWPRWEDDMLPAMRRVFASRQPQTIETPILRKRDGSYADYLISLFPISNDDSKSLLLALVGVDLSVIRKAEQEIAESQANLQAFFEYYSKNAAAPKSLALAASNMRHQLFCSAEPLSGGIFWLRRMSCFQNTDRISQCRKCLGIGQSGQGARPIICQFSVAGLSLGH
jgi:PAS domain S-box-containing protein